jgi:F420-dependent oxidoreductase-like protein
MTANKGRLRLGCSLGTLGVTPAAMADMARAAERLDYDCLWASEVVGTDPVPLLGWLAGQTTSIGLGTAVMQISARSPVATATGAAMLERISGGRFRLGLGASGPQTTEGWYGQPYNRPLARTRDYVAVVRMVLAGKPVSYRGETITLPLPGGEAAAMPVLSASPKARKVPVCLAALGPRSVALAGEISDAWIGIHLPPGYLSLAQTWLAQGAARSGRAPGEIDIAVMVSAHVDEDAATAREMVRPTLAVYLGGMGTRQTNFYNRLAIRLGFGAEAARIQDRFLDGSIDEAIEAVSDEMVDAMSVCGPADAVRRRLAAYRDAGASTVIVGPVAPTVEVRCKQLEILAELCQAIGSEPVR